MFTMPRARPGAEGLPKGMRRRENVIRELPTRGPVRVATVSGSLGRDRAREHGLRSCVRPLRALLCRAISARIARGSGWSERDIQGP